MTTWPEDLMEPAGVPHELDFAEETPGPAWSLLRGIAVQLLCMTLSASVVLNLFSPDVQWSVLLVMLAVVILSLRHLGGLLILCLVQADLVLTEERFSSAMPPAEALTYTFLILAVVMFIGRQRHTLQKLSQASLFRIPAPGAPSAAPTASDQDPVPARPFLNLLQRLSEHRQQLLRRLLQRLNRAMRGALLLAACSAVATCLVAWLPRGPMLARELRTAESLDPDMRWAALLVTGIVAIALVAGELSWRRMTAAQARVFQRSQLLSVFYRDFRLIVRQKIRARQKRYLAPARRTTD